MNRIAVRYKEITAEAAIAFDKHGEPATRAKVRELGRAVQDSPLPGAYAYITVGNVRYRVGKEGQ